MKDIEYMENKQDMKDKQNVIEVSHLKKYYKEVKAVDDISFSVKKGELFGFLGVNGAGKPHRDHGSRQADLVWHAV